MSLSTHSTVRRPATMTRGPGRPPGPTRAGPSGSRRSSGRLPRDPRARLPGDGIADVAGAADVSTGTVHYYFATRDEVLIAALKHATDRLFARVGGRRGASAAPARPPARGRGAARPVRARDEYVLWIELWLRVLHQPDLLPGIEALSSAGAATSSRSWATGAEHGDFDPVRRPDRWPTGSSRSPTASASTRRSATAGRRPTTCTSACSRSRPSSCGPDRRADRGGR